MITIQYNGFVSWQSWDFIKKNTMFMGFVFVYNHIKSPINKSKKHQSDLLGAVFLNFPQFFSEFSFFNQGNLPNHSPMAPWPHGLHVLSLLEVAIRAAVPEVGPALHPHMHRVAVGVQGAGGRVVRFVHAGRDPWESHPSSIPVVESI
jgi:hypothetical protein